MEKLDMTSWTNARVFVSGATGLLGSHLTAELVRRGRKQTDDLIASFRVSYNPRIAVTVDMIATGTDVKPLECVFFMRMVKSRGGWPKARMKAQADHVMLGIRDAAGP